jgi:hypothetical protein
MDSNQGDQDAFVLRGKPNAEAFTHNPSGDVF